MYSRRCSPLPQVQDAAVQVILEFIGETDDENVTLELIQRRHPLPDRRDRVLVPVEVGVALDQVLDLGADRYAYPLALGGRDAEASIAEVAQCVSGVQQPGSHDHWRLLDVVENARRPYQVCEQRLSRATEGRRKQTDRQVVTCPHDRQLVSSVAGASQLRVELEVGLGERLSHGASFCIRYARARSP